MKRNILLLTLLMMGLALSAQPTRPAKATFGRLSRVQADKHGIIATQPEGELRTYSRDGGATYATIYFIDDPQTGIISDVVFGEDGKKVYFKNIISHAATGTWVEGDIDGNTITVPLGQMVYWWDKDANGYSYGMRLARVKVNGSINDYTAQTTGSVTFTIDGDQIRLNGTSGDADSKTYDGLGLVYTDEFEGEWSYYLDYETVMNYVAEKPITPPADLKTELYSLENQLYGHIVRVGFDGNDVYIQGISETNLPNAWMKGTIEGDKLVFPLQCAGSLPAYMLYFCGVDGERVPTEAGGYTWVYDWTDGCITFDYDAETRSFSSQQTLLVNNSKEGVDRGEVFHWPRFRPYTEQAGTPADPKVIYFYTDYFERAGFNIAMFEVPLVDTEGRFMDPEKVSYQLYVDDDEPYTLYMDEYKNLTEDMDEVPYLFSNRNGTIIEKAYGIYIYQSGFDRFGIQSIYRGGGEEHRSNISYWYFDEDASVEGIANGSVASPVGYFDATGRRVGATHKGLTITRMSDGSVVKAIRK